MLRYFLECFLTARLFEMVSIGFCHFCLLKKLPVQFLLLPVNAANVDNVDNIDNGDNVINIANAGNVYNAANNVDNVDNVDNIYNPDNVSIKTVEAI